MKSNLSLKQLSEKIAEKSQVIGQVFEEAGPDFDFSKVKSLEGSDSAAKLEKIKALNAELADLKADHAELSAVAALRQKADEVAGLKSGEDALVNAPTQVSRKSIGQLIMASAAVKGEHQRVKFDIDPKAHLLDVDVKANFFTTSGWAPENLRRPGYVPSPTRPIAVIDQLPIFPTTQNSVVYMLETTFTNAAAEKAEGDAALESTLQLTETSEPVQEVATYIPTSKIQLEDVPFAEAYLTARLNFMVRQRLDSQILSGDGTPPNLKGTVNIGGSLQTQNKGTDPGPDAIYKAFTKVRSVGFAEPSVLFTHPNDWQDIRLLKTADGLYIFGNPNEPLDRIWGVPVVQTTAASENTMVTGDYLNFAYVAMRRGVEIEMSSGYSDYFVKGKLAVLASLRCAVVHNRTAAFCKITSM